MIVDTDLLRMGADFSQSAGAIIQRGADQFASSSLPSGVFGDFEAARGFHTALCRAHESQLAAMQKHRSRFEALATDANSAARIFVEQDNVSSSALDVTVRDLC